jgi:hypothetical protein
MSLDNQEDPMIIENNLHEDLIDQEQPGMPLLDNDNDIEGDSKEINPNSEFDFSSKTNNLKKSLNSSSVYNKS